MISTMHPPLLAAERLGVPYGRRVVFEGLSFSYTHGAVALVGPNGTGKSTLISLLCGIEPPHSGPIRIAGYDMAGDPRRAKAQLAYVPDDSVAYEFMRGREFLAMVDALRGTRDLPRASALIAGLGLDAYLDMRFDAMSLGTRKKFMLVSGLMSQAPLVVMDEPTNGIDADARQFLIALIRQAAPQRLFFFSTHDLELAEATGAQRLGLGAAAR